MNITLRRTEISENGVFGELFDDQNNLIAFTIERSFPDGPAIPNGKYKAFKRMSPHFGFELFCLMDVPGHSFIEIHKGNSQEDSKGCILLGSARNNNRITNSKDAFDKFMSMQSNCNEIEITVEDA